MAMRVCRLASASASRPSLAHRIPTNVRSYAQATPAASASSAATKPPVPLFGIDGTYASALVSFDIYIFDPLITPRSYSTHPSHHRSSN